MQSNSVVYILGFCAAVCLVCSIVVSSTAVGLKPLQEANKILDRQKKVLSVAGLIKEGQSVTPEKVQSLFDKRIKSVVVNLKKGKVDVESTRSVKSFDQLKATKDPATSQRAPKNRAGVLRIPNKALLYMVSKKDMKKDGTGFALSQYIFPIEGKGLWSTLYGFICLAPDFNVVKGLTFYEHKETPGLGGEVDNLKWKEKWINRLLFGKKGSSPKSWTKARLRVIKGTTGNAKTNPFKVDGLSGATITSNGVTYLVHFWMGKHGFAPFIQNKLGIKPGSH
jgi:Na+-transporting NADH:ubiquinone oxidoreductase subunit C